MKTTTLAKYAKQIIEREVQAMHTPHENALIIRAHVIIDETAPKLHPNLLSGRRMFTEKPGAYSPFRRWVLLALTSARINVECEQGNIDRLRACALRGM